MYSHYMVERNESDFAPRIGELTFFVGYELAHIGWVALSGVAKSSFDPHPYPVDFASGEACTGGAFTVPKYEGQRLMEIRIL